MLHRMNELLLCFTLKLRHSPPAPVEQTSKFGDRPLKMTSRVAAEAMAEAMAASVDPSAQASTALWFVVVSGAV